MSKTTITKKTGGQLSQRADRWVNERNQFGGSRDPVARTTFFRDVTVTREFMDSLYRYDWVTRKAVDIPAQDATRKWITLQHDNPKRVQEAEKELDRMCVQEKVEELIVLSRLYGAGMMVIGAWDGRDVTEPLGQVREVFYLSNVDRFLSYPQIFYTDRMSPKYGDPEIYQITRPITVGSDVALVHESRIIRLDGMYLPPYERLRNFTFGASVIENILEATRQFGIATQAMAGVMQDFVVKKLKVDNLQNLLQDADGMNALMTRLGELAAGMSIYGIATFGPDEEFDKMGTPITGLPDMADRFVEYVSAATGIPRSRLFSNQSGKLGGDAGENDLRVHYDNIEAFQKNKLRRPVQRLIDIILAPLGFEPGEMTFTWAPLWQMSDAEMADTALKVAQTDALYIQNNVVQPEEVAMSRFSGDGVNISDMHIETAPREKFLKEFAKSEPRSGEIGEEHDLATANAAKPAGNGEDKDAKPKAEGGNGAAKH